MARDELWLKHDARSRMDPKMAFFLKTEGMLGYGVFWALIETLHYQNEHEIELSIELSGLADQYHIDEMALTKIVDRLIECRLFKREGNIIYQPRMKREQAYRSLSKGASIASMSGGGRLGGIISGMKRRGASALEIQEFRRVEQARLEGSKGSNQRDKRDERDKKDKKDINTNTNTAAIAAVAASGPKKITHAKYKQFDENHFVLPHGWGDNAKTALSEWISYKASMGHPKTKTSYQAEVEHYQDSPQVYFDLVKRAVREGWRGLNENLPIGQGPGTKTAYGARKSQNILNQEASFAAVRSILNKNKKEKDDDDTRADEFDFM